MAKKPKKPKMPKGGSVSVNGINIEKLPFSNLTIINELLDFEGIPMLIHYQYTRKVKSDESKVDLFCYLVDYSSTTQRFLFWKVTKQELYLYLNKDFSLRRILEDTTVEYFYVVDKNIDGVIESIKCINTFDLPEKYLPSENSLFIYGLSEFYQQYLDPMEYEQRLSKKTETLP